MNIGKKKNRKISITIPSLFNIKKLERLGSMINIFKLKFRGNKHIAYSAIIFISSLIVLNFSFFHLERLLPNTEAKAAEAIKTYDARFADPVSNRVLGINQNSIYNNLVFTGKSDVRVYILEKYFEANNSPLVGTGHVFIEKCLQYGAPADCISVPAIAKHETDLCNYYVSAEQHNCWGWGGGGEYRQEFDSFETSIDTATRVLATQYGPRFMMDPRLMERVFCGPQAECDNWGNRIIFFMRELDDFSAGLGLGLRLTDFNPVVDRY